MVKEALIVAFGGGLGSVGRYWLSGWALHHSVDWRFPLGTFLVNLAGCLLVGFLGGLVVKHDFFSADVRLLLFTGVAGGFTTFSALGLETFYLLRRHEPLIAGSYVAATVFAGLLLLWLGFLAAGSRT